MENIRQGARSGISNWLSLNSIQVLDCSGVKRKQETSEGFAKRVRSVGELELSREDALMLEEFIPLII